MGELGATFNRIGTDGNGVADLAERNVVAGNTLDGIRVGAGSDNVVAGNYVGVDVTGTVGLGNRVGIFVFDSDNNRIGTNGDGIADTEERNVVSASREIGVRIQNSVGSVVAGNYIGADASGTVAIPNAQNGVLLFTGASGIRVGTDENGVADEAERNVISGNGQNGVYILGASNNFVVGNSIGVGSTGSALGNASSGILMTDDAGTNLVRRNEIAFNGKAGVRLSGAGTVANTIQQNSIYTNADLGIDLNDDGVTPNDTQDVDVGANNNQNYPVLFATTPGATTRAIGSINSTPNTTITLEFFANTVPDPSGFGEGERYLDSLVVVTDANGDADFDVFLAGSTTAGEFLTATATDAAGDTSEFSAAALIDNATASEQILTYLIGEIEDLVDEDVLNQGNGNALISKLENAISKIQQGNTNAAENQINAFINQVEAFVNSGKLTQEIADSLIELAELALNTLE